MMFRSRVEPQFAEVLKIRGQVGGSSSGYVLRLPSRGRPIIWIVDLGFGVWLQGLDRCRHPSMDHFPRASLSQLEI